MKKTKFILSQILPNLGFWVICLMMLTNISQTSAQTQGPLPSFKPRAEVIDIVNEEIQLTMNHIMTVYGTNPNNRPIGDPTYDRLMKKIEAVKVLMEMLSNPDHSIEASVTSAYPMLAYPYGPGLQQVVNLNGFYEGNWPPEFRAIVDKIKS